MIIFFYINFLFNLDTAETIFLTFFFLEMCLKIYGLGFQIYFNSQFNRFDFVVSEIIMLVVCSSSLAFAGTNFLAMKACLNGCNRMPSWSANGTLYLCLSYEKLPCALQDGVVKFRTKYRPSVPSGLVSIL